MLEHLEPAVKDSRFPERGARRRDLTAAVTEFLTEESAALDECRYNDWLDHLADGFIYQVPVPVLREDPSLPRHSDHAMLFEATKNVLSLKLGRIGLRHAWSDRPGGTVRHFIGTVRAFDTTDERRIRVDSNILASWSRGRGETALVSAARQDLVTREQDGELRLLRRRVLLDVEVATHEQLSIIF
ncbi:aromatic-ring-hydroxylating dioxygenase subunit beta [Lentzea sp. NPDC004782]|uniref:aromatic-ring-hydroxylating dioxygenase subunit beta n=1 Tax=Lentzea sp. NPDC004782 TaxID=3154458 RepID=UPI0033AC4743